jgi:hypothetical protein
MKEDDAALVATMTLFRALRREWVGRNPTRNGDECPIPEVAAMRPIDRQIFVRAMKSAIASAKPENVARVMEGLSRPADIY